MKQSLAWLWLIGAVLYAVSVWLSADAVKRGRLDGAEIRGGLLRLLVHLMRSPVYQRLFPGTRISAAKDTELEVMTTARGFRYATSVGGTLTGRGGNLLILDDPLN